MEHFRNLNEKEKAIIVDKDTEDPGSGVYENTK